MEIDLARCRRGQFFRLGACDGSDRAGNASRKQDPTCESSHRRLLRGGWESDGGRVEAVARDALARTTCVTLYCESTQLPCEVPNAQAIGLMEFLSTAAERLEAFWPHLVAAASLMAIIVASAHLVMYKKDTRAAIGWIARHYDGAAFGGGALRFVGHQSGASPRGHLAWGSASTAGGFETSGRQGAEIDEMLVSQRRAPGQTRPADRRTHASPAAGRQSDHAIDWRPRGLSADARCHPRGRNVGHAVQLYLRQRSAGAMFADALAVRGQARRGGPRADRRYRCALHLSLDRSARCGAAA